PEIPPEIQAQAEAMANGQVPPAVAAQQAAPPPAKNPFAARKPALKVVGGKDGIADFNPRHEPKGSSKGGQFAKAGSGGGGGEPKMSEEEWQALLAESRARVAAREARVQEIIANSGGKAVKMVSSSRPNYVAL